MNLWDALAVAAWVLATGLIMYDTFTHEEAGIGPLTPFGGLIALAAAVLTTAGVARRSKEEILRHMHEAFDLGRESVLRMKR